jgi:hypothetical protein
MILFNHNQLPRPSRLPFFSDSNEDSRILICANAEILVPMPNESSFLSVFFKKEAAIMKKIRRNDFDAKPPQPA